jgi:Ca2+-binding RTX toxin-like protein
VPFYQDYRSGTSAGETLTTSQQLDTYAAMFGGNDTVIGSTSFGIFGAYGSDDYFDGGNGNDILRGGLGEDWLVGGNGNDYLYGNFAPDGRTDDENDFIAPGAGNDYVDGGENSGGGIFGSLRGFFEADMVYYADATTGYGVVVDLAATATSGIAYDPWGGTDTLVNVEGAIGTFYGDYLYGNSGANSFIGWAGADYIYGAGGEDTIFYNIENPTAPTAFAYLFDTPQGVVVDLSTGFGRDPHGFYDTLISIENVYGTRLNDYIQGDGADNKIYGSSPDLVGNGNDVLFGGGGNDTITDLYGSANIDGGAGSDFIIAGGNDYIRGGSGSDTFKLRPSSLGVQGADFIADFSDAEDFLQRPDSGGTFRGPPLTPDTYTVFDYSGGGVTGVFVVFDQVWGSDPNHYVFVQNMTAATIIDNII